MSRTKKTKKVDRTPAHRRLAAKWKQAWTPPPDLSVSQWADRYRMLPPESSVAPGGPTLLTPSSAAPGLGRRAES